VTTRTRIVATLGPSTDRPGVIEAMIEAGLDVARINFSHGTADDHLRRAAAFRDAARRLGRRAAVLADLPGPKLRALLDTPRTLAPGQEVTFAAAPGAAADVVPTEPDWLAHVRPGQRVLLDDGRIVLAAVRLDGDRLLARVETGGTLQPKKGINLPDTDLPIPALTPRDREALAVAATAGVDWLALSFVSGPSAADELRLAAREQGLGAAVMAKVERPQAVEQAEAVVAAFDGIMVARGDLGVEIPLERVPTVQKRLIALARAAGKPVVTATEMLESMRSSPRPTRAEASDVANAIYDGTDAVMLSGETAVGSYPVEAVASMDRIAREADAHFPDAARELTVARGPVDHVTRLTCALAREIDADAIVTPTLSGRTARLVARYRPRAAIVAAAPGEEVLRRLALVWGLWPVLLPPELRPGEDRLEAAVRAAFEQGAVRAEQLLVVLAGHPVEGGDRFPTIRVVRVGEAGRSLTPTAGA
jgi:pyruvate kinase